MDWLQMDEIAVVTSACMMLDTTLLTGTFTGPTILTTTCSDGHGVAKPIRLKSTGPEGTLY